MYSTFARLSTLQFIYNSLQPHFDYCSVVWGICGKILGAKLQKLQNRTARDLPFSNNDTSSDHRFELLG